MSFFGTEPTKVIVTCKTCCWMKKTLTHFTAWILENYCSGGTLSHSYFWEDNIFIISFPLTLKNYKNTDQTHIICSSYIVFVHVSSSMKKKTKLNVGPHVKHIQVDTGARLYVDDWEPTFRKLDKLVWNHCSVQTK